MEPGGELDDFFKEQVGVGGRFVLIEVVNRNKQIFPVLALFYFQWKARLGEDFAQFLGEFDIGL